jgi:rhamnulokinase
MRALVAVDLGAESCRVSLLRWTAAGPRVELVHRLANGPVHDEQGSLRWPLDTIVQGVEHGLALCAERATEGVRSVAVDGWAVDYVRLDAAGKPLAPPFCYRDERTVEAERVLHERIPAERLAEITGLQPQRINTLYQQYADVLAGASCGETWTNLPEYLLHRWGGPAVAEYTNATHTEMVEQGTRAWSPEILEAAGIDAARMPRLVEPGTRLGTINAELFPQTAFRGTELIAPACHDTASAIAGIPVGGDEEDWGYISSGTWSLVGTVLHRPCLSADARAAGFTNLGGVAGSVLFHISVNGMWVLKQCMDAWEARGERWAVEELVVAAAEVAPPIMYLDMDDTELTLMGEMPERLERQLAMRGGTCPKGCAEIASLIFHSLAERYRLAFERMERLTGKKLKRLFVVGGGSRNALLRKLTAEKTGLEVLRGSAESSTAGNFAVQLAALEAGAENAAFGSEVSWWAGVIARAEGA